MQLSAVYAVTIFDRSGPSRFSKHIIASSEDSARKIASELWAGKVERVEFMVEIDAVEGF